MNKQFNNFKYIYQMKKSLILLGILAMGYANAQTNPEYNGRIGINIDLPKSSLHIGRHTGIPANSPQGLILPHLSTEQRDEFERTKLTNRLMIFNTTKNCIDWWNGTKWTCTDGTKADTPIPQTTPIQLPDIEIGNSMHWFSSIYDDDYLSNATGTPTLAIPTASASLTIQAADGIASGGTHEPILNVQGKIPSKENALHVVLPINVKNAGILPAFTTYLRIPAQYTKNNQDAIAVLSWEQLNPTTFHKYILARIYAENEEIELKQLDLVAGLGNDHNGILMGSFKYPRTRVQSEGPKSGWTGHYDLHLISGIPDKHFNKLTNISPEGNKYRHRFIYSLAYAPTGLDEGHIYLNNNLGANYANIYHEVFNPNQQAKAPTDHHSYGSEGQWGRVFDGHELITWNNYQNPTPTYPNIYRYPSENLTQFYDNCPQSWRTTKFGEDLFDSQYLQANTLGYDYNSHKLILGVPQNEKPKKFGGDGNIWDLTQNYWTSEIHSLPNKAITLLSGVSYMEYTDEYGGPPMWSVVYRNYANRRVSYAYRCIKN